ncbi:tetratricopeptide repeat protein (macronuclear) [Tetrahymena thermophila SB210]|uniref:Tetratricopeptide repeat protein n=1 Tax=Tetrahymena thermophila (strain SB210) TaxID=312017 RepID=W7X6H5_TETTS|nr:tetratricopeptide repeat protein [Tetrahymena thermophila SB210]EWS74990.1 tetratricopeptide repeat protein [Tetrahymena thermophila SB210]|eukprot:XP_012652489.1 tetratricopeptide repeat protein [Tetrahymena thermophila SB210]
MLWNTQELYLYLKQIIFKDKTHLLDKARDLYEKLLKLEPNSVTILLNLGGCYYKLGQFEQAIKYNQNILSIDPKNYLANFNQGIIYYQKGMTENAIKYFQKSFQSKSKYGDAIYNLGIIHGQNGNLQEAEYFNKLALQTNNDLAKVYQLLNIPESDIKITSEIKDIFEKVLNAKIEQGVDFYILAFVQNLLGYKGQALYNCEIAVKLNEILADAFQLKGQILKQQGQQKEAIKCFDKFLELKPYSTFPNQKMRRVYHIFLNK